MAERQAATRRLLEAMRQDERQLEAAAEGPGSAGAAAAGGGGRRGGRGDAVGRRAESAAAAAARRSPGTPAGKASRVRIQTASRGG
ncbi:Protein of unknown function [Gryllus bimaculatus]|nr:Protein of unknown function [Gryllus bimaculatus]